MCSSRGSYKWCFRQYHSGHLVLPNVSHCHTQLIKVYALRQPLIELANLFPEEASWAAALRRMCYLKGSLKVRGESSPFVVTDL